MQRSSQSRGFTLVELMVSIAIALLLVLGVNAVFKATSQTVGAGESLLGAERDGRTISQTFLADTGTIDPVPAAGSTVGDAPFFIIHSDHVYAFRNADDLQQQSVNNPSFATDPTTDVNQFPTGPTLPNRSPMFPSNQAPVVTINPRSHRIDRLEFFTRGVTPRQTPPSTILSEKSSPVQNAGCYVSTTTGTEALVSYGHAQLPNKQQVTRNGTPSWYNPGAANNSTTDKNDFNFFAADWMLARFSALLMPTPPVSDSVAILRPTPATPIATSNNGLHPLADSDFYTGTVDLATISIGGYTAQDAATAGINSYALSYNGQLGTQYGKDWWDALISTRLQASPYIASANGQNIAGSVRKVSPSTLAQVAPTLIRGCSQFIVEYAGNFYTKDALGNAIDTTVPNPTPGMPALHVPVPDPTGQLDFYAVRVGNSFYRRIRWYGYPRPVIYPGGTFPNTATPAFNSSNGDVVPLRDVLSQLGGSFGPPGWSANNGMSDPTVTPSPPPNCGALADAERFSANFPKPNSNYWTAMTPTMDQNPSTHYTYTAAWGPDVRYQAFPKMIRIIVEVEDHEGRLKNPQRFEFVYDISQ